MQASKRPTKSIATAVGGIAGTQLYGIGCFLGIFDCDPPTTVYPVEHAQASARLADIGNNAYFMFTSSQNTAGYIFIVEVKGIDPSNPQHMTGYSSSQVVWWSKLADCSSEAQCNLQSNEGNFNHPARIARLGHIAAVAFQNYSFNSGRYPTMPSTRGADAIGFYDVSNPKKPIFLRKLVRANSETWGNQIPRDNDISEVTLAKAGQYYFLTLGDSDRVHYRMDSIYGSNQVSPLLSAWDADNMTLANYSGTIYPTKIRFSNKTLSSTKVYFDQEPDNILMSSTREAFESEGISYGSISLNENWKNEACRRAWGFQSLPNGGYNVICHQMQTDEYKFFVRGVDTAQ